MSFSTDWSHPNALGAIRAWLQTVVPMGNTNPKKAMETALKSGADSIYFMTDGDWERMTAFFVNSENSSRIPINTIAFTSVAGVPILKKISEDSGGTHKYVP